MKIISAILLISICLINPSLWAEDVETKTISGTVVDLDWVSSTICVLYSDPYSGKNDELDIKITSDTVMRRGAESISLSDILQSDAVTVTYYDDGASGLKATHITDLNTEEIME